jgi:hypothetical protein
VTIDRFSLCTGRHLLLAHRSDCLINSIQTMADLIGAREQRAGNFCSTTCWPMDARQQPRILNISFAGLVLDDPLAWTWHFKSLHCRNIILLGGLVAVKSPSDLSAICLSSELFSATDRATDLPVIIAKHGLAAARRATPGPD